MSEMNPKVAKWMAEIVERIGSEHSFDAGYGEYHLGKIPIMFDGDPNTGLAIAFDEHGELTICTDTETAS